jgi:phenylalanyl-tRNA synthetase beta chain
MIISYNWLKDYLKGRLPKAEKLAELLTLYSFEIEEIKKSGKDWLLDVDILPNRAYDCLSFIGVAREVAAITGLSFKKPSFKVKEDKGNKTADFISVEIKDKKSCPRYTARVVTNVKIRPSSRQIQQRLKALGLQPINNIVDVMNYVMLETGQPLHAFDLDKLETSKSKKQIIVRKARLGEKINALDGKRYKLDKDILVITDRGGPLAIAGMKGGKKAEISKTTKTIVIESANFDMKIIRQARQKLNLQTDASLRFEHEPDPNLTVPAINRVAQMVKDISGGEVAKGVIDIYPNKISARRIRLDLSQTEKLLGVKVSKSRILKIFNDLGFKVLESKGGILKVEIPTFRRDLSIPEDLIEEVGRVYGFGKVPSEAPRILALPPERNEDIFWGRICKDILKEAGFSEVYNYSFISQKDIHKFSFAEKELIEIENPISLEQKYLRSSLIPNLLKNVRENLKYFPGIKIFELGKIYRNPGVSEKRVLTGLIVDSATGSEDFYRAKGVIDLLFQKLGIANVWYDDFKPTPEESKKAIWQIKKSAEIKVDQKEVGFLGEVRKEILEKMDISKKVVVFDLDFEKLQKLCAEEHEYQPISRFPAAVRDLAILIPREVRVAEIFNKINVIGGSLIRDIDLFDIYEGEEIPQGKKNLAFHIIYQASDRTLKKGEIDKIQQKIIKTLEKIPGWEVRK